MDSRIEKAVERKRSGHYNCAQAVACTYCDVAGVDEGLMLSAAGAFGAGMGCMEGTCGALVGAGMVAGMVRGDRAAAMRDMKQMVTRFKATNGSVVCRELKGIGSGCPLRECDGCVADAAALLEDVLAF